MQRTLVGGAVARGLAAAGLQIVDGTFDKLPDGEQVLDPTLVIVEQGLEGLAQTAGAIGRRSQRRILIFMLYTITTYRIQDVLIDPNPSVRKIVLECLARGVRIY